jgi:hypothetical protein
VENSVKIAEKSIKYGKLMVDSGAFEAYTDS